MMSVDSWVLYLTILLFSTGSPGPAAFFIMKSSVLYGRKRALYGILGNLLGLLCLGIISITGLGGILKTSETIFNIIKYAGAIYLIYLGVKQIFQRNSQTEIPAATHAKSSVKNGKIFKEALFIALTNPKAIVLMITLFPQFIQLDQPITKQFLSLTAVLLLFSFSFLATYTILAYSVRTIIKDHRRMQILNWISGSVLITFGCLMLRIPNHK